MSLDNRANFDWPSLENAPVPQYFFWCHVRSRATAILFAAGRADPHCGQQRCNPAVFFHSLARGVTAILVAPTPVSAIDLPFVNSSDAHYLFQPGGSDTAI
jgi:hypothetical protein